MIKSLASSLITRREEDQQSTLYYFSLTSPGVGAKKTNTLSGIKKLSTMTYKVYFVPRLDCVGPFSDFARCVFVNLITKVMGPLLFSPLFALCFIQL